MAQKTIAIVGGGNSSEAEISVKSAFNLKSMLADSDFLIHVVFIQENVWVVKDETGDISINKSDFSFEKNGKKICFDCVYLTIHGTPGEDGRLQSYFELIGIPYTSCNVFTSALTFNKFATKSFLKEYNIKTADAILIRKNDTIDSNQITKRLGLPCFVKPNNGGSSFGVTKVNATDQIQAAVSKALEEDSEVIIESFLKGIELTNGAYKTGASIEVLPITEIRSENDFFDYDAKYKGKSKEITPAELSEELTKKCKDLTRNIYNALDCFGLARVDYILSENEFFFLEINTTPGLSPASIIPQQIRAAGYKEKDVFSKIINEAITQKKEVK
ncbi:MAG: D-alanine--D-alanine ligase [Bacteroidales bacterium]|nr:D-alanine--D-alanine ligase [Bacteroidales bacterium]